MIHWRLLRHSFLCIGDIYYIHNIPSELMPLALGWNGDNMCYLIKYVYKQDLYVLILSMSETSDTVMDAKLHSDTAITSFKVKFNDCVDDNLVINMSACHALSRSIDTCLIERLLDLMSDEAGPRYGVADVF